MSDIEYIAIDAERLARMRERGSDEHGNPWTLRMAEGWEPLRCCLTIADEGAEIVLIGYTPMTEPSPWAETGPVFVHFGPCAGYGAAGEYPAAFRHSRSTVQPFDESGSRVYQHIAFLEPDDDHAAAVRQVLEQPEVAYAHVRSATAACFAFEVRAVR